MGADVLVLVLRVLQQRITNSPYVSELGYSDSGDYGKVKKGVN